MLCNKEEKAVEVVENFENSAGNAQDIPG